MEEILSVVFHHRYRVKYVHGGDDVYDGDRGR